MSILNLNAPQGRSSSGKKSAKIWMGVGLLVAVLGFGSTFAANITLNSPGGTTEFGQGVSQTVYCGGNQSVTVTPISSYQNTIQGEGTPAQSASSFSARIVNSGSSSDYDVTTSVTKVTIAASSATTVPRFSSGSASAKSGWWLSSPTSSSPINPQPSISEVAANPTNYYFVYEYSTNKYRKASSSGSSSFQSTSVISSNAIAASPGPVTPATFKLGGVLISNIPIACDGVDFVLSSYGETGTAQTLISGSGVNVTEVAALWTGSGAVTVSRDRSAALSTSLVTGEQSTNSLKFVFNTSSGTALSAQSVYKLIVETQEDALS